MGVQSYILLGAFAVFVIWRFYRQKKVRAQLPDLLAQGAIVVDVRTSAEFKSGANPNSINIPLNILSAKALELDKAKPIIVCCASGARSGAAVGILKGMGFSSVVNGGPWTNTLF